jgi:hypothetical protein
VSTVNHGAATTECFNGVGTDWPMGGSLMKGPIWQIMRLWQH